MHGGNTKRGRIDAVSPESAFRKADQKNRLLQNSDVLRALGKKVVRLRTVYYG
jgi:hypothetical protein